MITNKGLVAIVMTQTDTCVAPHGGAERFLGTNPIAFGFPVENSHPMIVDMATSATAFGKILHAKETGKHIGEGLAIDKTVMAPLIRIRLKTCYLSANTKVQALHWLLMH